MLICKVSTFPKLQSMSFLNTTLHETRVTSMR